MFCGVSTSFEVRSTSFYVVETTSKPGGRGIKRNGGSIILSLSLSHKKTQQHPVVILPTNRFKLITLNGQTVR